MIRPFTLLCFCAFAGAGAWLYQVKHAVAMKDRELVEIRRQTEGARQRIDILRAEWALLNEPGRLRQTATRVLTLEPMQPQHFTRQAELDRRLPAAIAFAGAPDLFAPPPGVGVMLAAATVPAPAASAPSAAVRAPEAPAPAALAAAVAAQRAEQASRAPLVAAARPAPRPVQPRPIQPAAVQPTAIAAVVEPAARPVAPPTAIASALGAAAALGRPLLAPPVPISPAAAATLR